MAKDKAGKKQPATRSPIPASLAKVVPLAAARPRVLRPHSTGHFLCHWSHFDHDGPYGLASAGPVFADLMRRLSGFESMRPAEIFCPSGPGKDYYDLGSLPSPKARRQLEELGFLDEDRISCLRITGERRLYGFRRDPDFYAVFWDPGHEIWPSRKKHT